MDIRDTIQLDNHLRYNFYPSVLDAFPAAVEAIEAVNAGEGWTGVELPSGKIVEAFEVIEELHLEFFIEDWQGACEV